MKTNKTATKLKPGMTLIEITVVILVLLTLIAVLFIGANIYKKGADRAACILNIRNIHQAVRADQNLNNKKEDDAIVGDIMAPKDYIADPNDPKDFYFENHITCPSAASGAGSYNIVTAYPATGIVAATCTYDLVTHIPDGTEGW